MRNRENSIQFKPKTRINLHGLKVYLYDEIRALFLVLSKIDAIINQSKLFVLINIFFGGVLGSLLPLGNQNNGVIKACSEVTIGPMALSTRLDLFMNSRSIFTMIAFDCGGFIGAI